MPGLNLDGSIPNRPNASTSPPNLQSQPLIEAALINAALLNGLPSPHLSSRGPSPSMDGNFNDANGVNQLYSNSLLGSQDCK